MCLLPQRTKAVLKTSRTLRLSQFQACPSPRHLPGSVTLSKGLPPPLEGGGGGGGGGEALNKVLYATPYPFIFDRKTNSLHSLFRTVHPFGNIAIIFYVFSIAEENHKGNISD